MLIHMESPKKINVLFSYIFQEADIATLISESINNYFDSRLHRIHLYFVLLAISFTNIFVFQFNADGSI